MSARDKKYRRANFTSGPCYLPPDLDPLIEDLQLKAMVVRVIAYLGLAAALTWALHFWATAQ